MRLSYVLLLAAATLLARADALSTEGGAEKRLLRAHKTHKKAASATAAEEERGDGFLGLFGKLPEELPQFQRMMIQPEYKNNIFESWRKGMVSIEGATAFMMSEKLTADEIKLWTERFLKYLHDHKAAQEAAEAARAAAHAK
ncbi:putative secreted RxLR effector protein [Phytophthora cinnamomi]|uniref:putative secreted RxLR effector protein n=1 Tax=Phytophthora cinnamomi TaxID=4785 RepID=UPI002A257592|nr:putative secreted RxLR effector protein [Phytophthora cinnamomi]KAJ8571223.1 hypothetical protein ON010_g5611 [Phytophthora cinnamomi]